MLMYFKLFLWHVSKRAASTLWFPTDGGNEIGWKYFQRLEQFWRHLITFTNMLEQLEDQMRCSHWRMKLPLCSHKMFLQNVVLPLEDQNAAMLDVMEAMEPSNIIVHCAPVDSCWLFDYLLNVSKVDYKLCNSFVYRHWVIL